MEEKDHSLDPLSGENEQPEPGAAPEESDLAPASESQMAEPDQPPPDLGGASPTEEAPVPAAEPPAEEGPPAAEAEPPAEEGPPAAEAEPPAAEEEPEPELPVEEPVSPGRSRLRRGFRWALVLLVVFALGMLAFAVAFYLPAVRASQQLARDLSDEKAALESQIGDLESRVEELEAEIASLSTRLETAQEESQALEETLQTAVLHRLILSALADVNAARLALETGDADGARLALANTLETIEAISELVQPEHQESVQAIAARLELALLVLESDPEAASSDLEVLATNLSRLEKNYFVEP